MLKISCAVNSAFQWIWSILEVNCVNRFVQCISYLLLQLLFLKYICSDKNHHSEIYTDKKKALLITNLHRQSKLIVGLIKMHYVCDNYEILWSHYDFQATQMW